MKTQNPVNPQDSENVVADTKRTPTPWRTATNPNCREDSATYINDAKGRTVATLDSDSSVKDEANAAFIVEAVNAHGSPRKQFDRPDIIRAAHELNIGISTNDITKMLPILNHLLHPTP